MPRALRRASMIRGTFHLINQSVFIISYISIALSLFFFAPGRMMSVRIAVLSGACVCLLLTAANFSKRKKRATRLPLFVLGMGGALFIAWGAFVAVRALLAASQDISVIVNGGWFLLFGIVTAMSASFAGK